MKNPYIINTSLIYFSVGIDCILDIASIYPLLSSKKALSSDKRITFALELSILGIVMAKEAPMKVRSASINRNHVISVIVSYEEHVVY